MLSCRQRLLQREIDAERNEFERRAEELRVRGDDFEAKDRHRELWLAGEVDKIEEHKAEIKTITEVRSCSSHRCDAERLTVQETLCFLMCSHSRSRRYFRDQ